MKQGVRKTRGGLIALGMAGVMIAGYWSVATGHASVASNTIPVTGTAVAAPVAVRQHPLSGLAVIPVTVTTAKGTHVFQSEVAASPAEQERGLMWRKTMAPDEAMIFPSSPPRRTAFWMRNTVMALDIVYIGADHTVLNIAANAVPYDETPLPSAGAVAGVLELNAGRAAQIGLQQGDRIDW